LKLVVSRVCESLDRFTEALTGSDQAPTVADLHVQIEKLRADIFADIPVDEKISSSCHPSDVEMTAASFDAETETVESRKRVASLETELVQSRHEAATLADRLEQAANQVAHLEGRVRELVDHENRLNAELETERLADHRHTLEQDQQILYLRSEVDAMRKSEASLRENLGQMSVRCEESLSQAKSDNLEAVGRLTAMLQDNQAELLGVLTELEVAKQTLEVTAGKLDERSAQLEDALRRLKAAQDAATEAREHDSDLRRQIAELASERGLLSERVAAYESSAVDGAKELIGQSSELEKRLAERDGTVVKLELVVTDLREAIRNSEGRGEALAVENARLRQELDAANADRLEVVAGLEGKLKLFEQVVGHKDREISNLRSELSTRKESAGAVLENCQFFGVFIHTKNVTVDVV